MVSYLYLKINMGITNKDFQNPDSIAAIRTRQLRVRIQKLQDFLVVAQHTFTKAVVKQELDRCVDEYVIRKRG